MVGREVGGGNLVIDSPSAKQRAAASRGVRRKRMGSTRGEPGPQTALALVFVTRVWNQVWKRQRFAATGTCPSSQLCHIAEQWRIIFSG